MENKKSKGLGDTIEKITKATGIKKVVDTVAKATGIKKVVDTVSKVVKKDCGCGERKDTLNRLFPYNN